MDPFSAVRAPVDATLRAFVDRQRPMFTGDLAPLLDAAITFLEGGKRFRAAFCYWGWRAAGGGESVSVIIAASSLELLQASALVHDDVMDDSDTRRGAPSAHRRFEEMHRSGAFRGRSDAFGANAAILLGDLFLVWSDEMFSTAGFDRKDVFDRMRSELMAGQYLDLLEQTAGENTFDSAHRVALWKSGRYSVERPLELGLTLAGGNGWVPGLCREYGGRIGVAFQMRDDILGVFGDPAQTGKPAGDDLREGKRTMLIAKTLELASGRQRDAVRRALGDPSLTPDAIADVREIIHDTGALAASEEMIKHYVESAMHALDQAPITSEAHEALSELAIAATSRHT